MATCDNDALPHLRGIKSSLHMRKYRLTLCMYNIILSGYDAIFIEEAWLVS